MKRLIALTGIPGSGKSTYARKLVKKDPLNTIIVNRDDIRSMLGDYWVPSRESLVTDIEHAMIEKGLDKEYTVIVDATNLSTKTIGSLQYIAALNNVNLEFKHLEIPVYKAIFRDIFRWFKGGRHVGIKVIMSFHNRYK